jgi:small subunit ribosomal protein S3
MRIGIIKDWDSRWYANRKSFPDQLAEDTWLRGHIKRQNYQAGISRIEIERAANRLKVFIHTAKPGIVIGKGGAGVDGLRRMLETRTQKQVHINIVEIKNPDTDAQLVAESIATQLERRVGFKRAMKQAVQRAMRQGAKGVKVMSSGRLGGAEMHRREWYWEGTVPLHTLRADIDYGFAEAHTTYGQIGVKVWVYKGEIHQPRAVAQGGQ